MPAKRNMRKRAVRRNHNGFSKTILFWAAFFVVVALLFIINVPNISRTWKNVFGARKNVGTEQTERPIIQEGEGSISVAPNIDTGAQFESEPSPSANGALQTEIITQTDFSQTDGLKTEVIPLPPAKPPLPKQPELSPAAQKTTENVKPTSRERTIYFVRVDNAGLVLLNAVKRDVTVNESPLVTTLNILLQGPSAAEKKQGLITLVPEGTRVLSAAIEHNTARINFNENFMYNSFGAEGYIAQLKQIIWTATEFVNINEVQIIIDGKQVEYLGETVRIDKPRSRDSF